VLHKEKAGPFGMQHDMMQYISGVTVVIYMLLLDSYLLQHLFFKGSVFVHNVIISRDASHLSDFHCEGERKVLGL